MSSIPQSVKTIQNLEISADEITYLVGEMARAHQEGAPGEVDFYTAIAILSDRYREDHDRCFCVIERMRCLIELMGDDRMRGWTIQGIEKGCTLTNEAIFRATARCPLKADAKRAWFDADEFFQITLSETDAEGRA